MSRPACCTDLWNASIQLWSGWGVRCSCWDGVRRPSYLRCWCLRWSSARLRPRGITTAPPPLYSAPLCLCAPYTLYTLASLTETAEEAGTTLACELNCRAGRRHRRRVQGLQSLHSEACSGVAHDVGDAFLHCM